MSDCIFCRIVDNTIPSRKVYEDDECLAFEDVNPQARVHILVIPKRHLISLADVQESDRALIGHLMMNLRKGGKRKRNRGFGISGSGEHWRRGRTDRFSFALSSVGRP